MTITLPTKEYEGYIFDCDGTLAHSMPAHYEAFKVALRRCGASFDFSPEVFQSVAGMGHEAAVKIFNERFGVELEVEPFLKHKHEAYEQFVDTVEPIKPVVEFAKKMLSEGKAVAVASGGERSAVLRTLDSIGLGGKIKVIVTQSDVSKGKPDPEMFFLAAKLLGINPKKCVVFEDSALGRQGAHDAGMDSIAIPVSVVKNPGDE
ncbi:putative multi-domain containing protein [Aduncisulcus paluster]|uniref:Multi-domain containing protein n=1 Tax=Aduncisulcus paluster TaxID=2918883 RepID=A0ABQ5KXW9_9EUKA|nr:putative multi-domain containing protein [Aduncisulcus paluster]